MGLFSKKKLAKPAKKPAAKKAKATSKNGDASAVMERMKKKQAENPDSCPFC